MPDPVRMRQVLAWCARTVSDKQWKLGQDGVFNSKPVSMAMHIQEQLIKSLLNGQINTSWYHRPVAQLKSQTHQATEGVLSPNPINAKNAKTLKKWQSIIENFKAEDQMWSQTAARYSAAHAKALDTYPRTGGDGYISAKWHASWTESLSPIEQQFLNHHCSSSDDGKLWQLMNQATQNFQAKLDVIEHATQTAVAEMNKMDRTADEIVMTISSALNSKQYGSRPRNRDQSVLSPDPSLLLRLISGNND